MAETIQKVEQFLYREARLLDERRFHEWLEVLADDIRYWMPVRGNRYAKTSKAIAILDVDGYVEEDIATESEMAYFDETKDSLARRVARLDTGMAWAEEPPSKTQHMITNVEVEPGDTPAELRVYSNFIVARNRAETEEEFYIGRRKDILRQLDNGFKIARRKIVLNQSVLLAKNISIFF